MRKVSVFLIAIIFALVSTTANATLPVTSNLIFHYDAGSLTGFTAGDSVLQWPDLETSVNNVPLYYNSSDTNFAPYKAPKYVANVINGNPAVRFSSTDKSLLRSAQSSWGGWTASGGTTMFIVATGGNSADEQRAFQIGKCGDWNLTGGEYNANKSMAIGLKSDRGFSGSYFNSGYTLAESPFVEGQWHISVHQQAYGQLAGTGSYSVDGITGFATYMCGGTATINWYATNNTSLMGTCTGRAVGDWQPSYNGDIAEVIVYRAMLSTAQKQSVCDYLCHKYITCGAHNPAPIPAAVNIGAQAGSLVEVDFSWNTGLTANGASVNPDIAAHYLYISTNRNFTGATPITIPAATSVQNYTTNLNPGTKYFWRVDESILIDGQPSAPNDPITLRGNLWQFTTRTSTSVAQPVVGAWKPIFRGAELAYASTNYPRLEKITAIRIDLQDPGLSFYMTPDNGALSYETTRQTGSAFMSSSGCSIGINAHYYLTYGDYADLEGLGMSNGNVVSPPTDDWPSGGTLLITPANVATIAKTYATTDTAPYRTAVESRQWFVLNQGTIYDYGDVSTHPRSAVGITQDGRYMVLMTIDGRQTGYSEGAEIPEVAQWLMTFGSYMGLNLDGGGSTHMLMRNKVGTIVTLNSPSENREVGSHLGAYLAPAPSIRINLSDAPVTEGLIIHLRADVLELDNGQPVKLWPDTFEPDSVDGTVYSYGGCGIPTFKTNACNGLPAVHFSAASKQALMSDAWSWDQTKGVTMIMVCTGGDTSSDMAAHVGDLDGTAYKTLACDVSSRTSLYSYGSGVQYNNGWCRTSTAAANPVQSGVWHTSVRKIAQNAGYGSLVYAINSFPAITVETNQPAKNTAFTASNNVIAVGNARANGDWMPDTSWYNGDVAEILVYNKQLTEAQMQQMMIHLNQKYSLYYNPGDFEPDKDVDLDDLAVLASQWLSIGPDLTADIYPSAGDGKVDISDFAEFTRYWMTTIE